TVDGVIANRRDRSQFTFSANAGTVISAQVFARRLGSPLDPVLRLLAPDGTQLATNDNFSGLSSDSRLDVQLSQDGFYTLEVGSSGDRGSGPDHTYQLTLELGAVILVRLFEAPGAPVASDDSGIQVTVADASDNQVDVAFDQNPATFLLPPGDYQLRTKLDSAERLMPLTLAPGQDQDIVVEFDFGRLRVQVLENQGILAHDPSTILRSDSYFASGGGSELEVRLPGGRYAITSRVEGYSTTVEDVLVEVGTVHELVINLGLERLAVELPAARGIILASGDIDLTIEVVQDRQVKARGSTNTSATEPVSVLARPGPAVVRYVSGLLHLEVPVTVPEGEILLVPFDAATLAVQHNLSLFTVSIRNQEQLVTQGTQVTLIDPRSRTLLALASDPPPDTTWLAPGGILLRSRLGSQERVRRDIPTGSTSEVVIDFGSVAIGEETGFSRVRVNIALDSPQEGTIVEGEQATITGRASVSGPPGVTRIAMVLDASGSAIDPSGADLNEDGREESIIQAEVAGGLLLLDELVRVEDETPGTTFALTIVRFSSGGEAVAPLTSLSDPEGVAALRAALESIPRGPVAGGTNYEAALNAAVREMGVEEAPGNAFILFMTDGEPNSVKPSLDAALRAGLVGVVIHTIGLGNDFQGEISPRVFFPPEATSGPDILAAVAAAGATGGTVTALPTPADIVQIVPSLPALVLSEAKLQAVQAVNLTTGQPAFSVELGSDGSFHAQVPVELFPQAALESNTLAATAIASDGASTATARVQVRSAAPPPALSATLSAIDQNRGALEVGDLLSFVLTLTNTGAGAARSLDITIPLPQGIVLRPGTLRASQPATLTEEAGQLRIQLSTLPPAGDSRNNVVITFQGIFQGEATLQATVASQGLEVQVSDDPFTVAEGDATAVPTIP
ncbi:MAG: VWA domain-containing protein, partial [Deinococcus sp.]|nr:VWA domain-containing protein [Deinococcus sp.]